MAVVLALAGMAYPVGAEPPPQKWALIVGVDRYDSDQISPLKCAAADAHALEAALVEVAGFPKNHIIVMTSDGAPADRPSAENILDRLAGFRSACKPGDEFVFFFSGHGMEEDGESYLLTCNARLGSNASLKKSCLAVKEVQAALAEVKATRILQLVDACRNDPRAGRSAADNHLSRGFSRDLVLKPKGSSPSEAKVTLFSCKVGQRSYEGYKNHGYFTWFLVEGLRGAAASNGVVTIPGLVAYLEKEVGDTVRLNEAGKEQNPWADVSGSGAMTWEVARPGNSGSASRPAVPPAAVATSTKPKAPDPGPVAASSSSGPTPNSEAVTFGPLVPYIEPHILSINVPGNWVKKPTTIREGQVVLIWVPDADKFKGIIMLAKTDVKAVSDAAKEEMFLKDFLQVIFGKHPQFEMKTAVGNPGAVGTWSCMASATSTLLLQGRCAVKTVDGHLVVLLMAVPSAQSQSLNSWFEQVLPTIHLDSKL